MKRRPSLDDARRNDYDALLARGWDLIENEVPVYGVAEAAASADLVQAAECFRQANEINSDGWQALWALGRVKQTLSGYPHATEYYRRAVALYPKHTAMVRWAGYYAYYAGAAEDAVYFCRIAVNSNKKDPGLRMSLALAYLISGDTGGALVAMRDAEKCAGKATPASQSLMRLIRDVQSGSIPCPRSGRDLSRHP